MLSSSKTQTNINKNIETVSEKQLMKDKFLMCIPAVSVCVCLSTLLPQQGSPSRGCPSWNHVEGCRAPHECCLCQVQWSRVMSRSPLKENETISDMKHRHPWYMAFIVWGHFEPRSRTESSDKMSYLAWAQAACPRTGNSSELPPPWFWQGLGRQRTVQWPFGSPVVYQLATNSPLDSKNKLYFIWKGPNFLKSTIIFYSNSSSVILRAKEDESLDDAAVNMQRLISRVPYNELAVYKSLNAAVYNIIYSQFSHTWAENGE